MRRYVFSFLFLIVLLLSCSKEYSNLNIAESTSEGLFQLDNSTRSLDKEAYAVTLDDINSYVNFKKLLSKDLDVLNICQFPEEGEPLLYIINYDGYWEIISGDKRTYAVISSGSGKFDKQSINDNCLAWIRCQADKIRVLKNSESTTTNAWEYQTFWKCVTADTDYIRNISETRSGVDTSYHPVPGHYELDYVEEFLYVIDSIPHLISTKWGQSAPYNQFCPLDYSYYPYYNPQNCFTGCVPLAGGQVINYYHNFSGCCPSLYDSAFVNTREYPYTNWDQMTQWHKTSANWAKMSSVDSSRMAAVLVANIGKGIQAKYGYFRGFTASSLAALHRFMNDEYELDSDFLEFNVPYNLYYNYIEELLVDGFPSIVAASDGETDLTTHSNHAFIIDRYKHSRVDYHFCYLFYPDDPDDPNADPPGSDGIIYIYHAPATTYFGMNWGFFGQNDDTWCVKSGDWYCGQVNYLYREEMLTFRCDGGAPGQEYQSIEVGM